MVDLASPEFRFLATLTANAAGTPDRPGPIGSPLSGARLLQVIERHRMPSSVMALLAQSPNVLTADQRERLNEKIVRSRMSALRMTAELIRIVAALDGAGIRHLILKGPPLSQRLYGDIAARHSKDLDILVEPQALAASHEVLTRLGYRRTHAAIPLPAKSAAIRHVEKDDSYINVDCQVEVELHWRLFNLAALMPLPFEAMWTEQDTVTLGGRAIAVLSPRHEFLYLCCHGALHGWFRLKWLQDIARILQIWPADTLLQINRLTHELKLEPTVAGTLALVQELLGIVAPAPLQSLTAPSRPSQALTRFSRQSLALPAAQSNFPSFVRQIGLFLLWSRLRAGIRFKCSVLGRALVTTQDVTQLPLPQWAFGLYYPLRPVLLLSRYLRSRRQAGK